VKRLLFLLLCFVISLPSTVHGQKNNENALKIAFTRDGFVWIKTGAKEERITKQAANILYPPQWSHDGKWILYQKEMVSEINSNKETHSEIWVYNMETKEHRKIFHDGVNAKWSPKENIVAFLSGGVLNVSNLDDFKNVALGVDNFEWYPDGRAVFASSAAAIKPDGWTNPELYKIPIGQNFKEITMSENVQELFKIPKELSNGKVSILSINASSFAFSPDGKWVSFIVNPTASWSMDSDMVCVITADGENFEVLDETILGIDQPSWAPSENLLGYIAGGGRIVFGFKNKKLKVQELPAFKSNTLTPPNFAEMGFTWVNDNTLIVSRVVEAEWNNDPNKRPNPALYMIKMKENEQPKITNPKKGQGDFQPNYASSANKLTWVRKNMNAMNGDLWIADINGKNSELWVKNIGLYSIY